MGRSCIVSVLTFPFNDQNRSSADEVLVRNPEEKAHLEDLGVDGTILKWVGDWSHYSQSSDHRMALMEPVMSHWFYKISYQTYSIVRQAYSRNHFRSLTNHCVVVEALSYEPEGRGFQTWWGKWIFSICLIIPASLGPGVYSASNRNEYQEQKNVSGE
jgi:hypothetical protein